MENQDRHKLILIRHSMPEIVPGVPASQWRLSDEGRRRSERLAERLAAYEPCVVVASLEPKAIKTGQIVARILGIRFETAPDLHEHQRPKVEVFGTRQQFEAQVTRLFEHPAELVFGNETADEAHGRFASAVDDVLATERHVNLAVVTHGTVLTLFVARAAGLDPVPFWKRLELPSLVVLSLPDLSPEVVENVT